MNKDYSIYKNNSYVGCIHAENYNITELKEDDVMDHCYVMNFTDINNNIIAGFASDSTPKIENDDMPYIFKVYLD